MMKCSRKMLQNLLFLKSGKNNIFVYDFKCRYRYLTKMTFLGNLYLLRNHILFQNWTFENIKDFPLSHIHGYDTYFSMAAHKYHNDV